MNTTTARGPARRLRTHRSDGTVLEALFAGRILVGVVFDVGSDLTLEAGVGAVNSPRATTGSPPVPVRDHAIAIGWTPCTG